MSELQDRVAQQEQSMKAEWRHHPTTERLLRFLRDDKANIMDRWARAGYTHATAEGTAQMNAQALGNVEAIDALLEWITNED